MSAASTPTGSVFAAGRRCLWIILGLGLLIRLATLTLPGTGDTSTFQMWGAMALRTGLLNVYGLKDREVLAAVYKDLKGEKRQSHIIVTDTDLGTYRDIPDYPPGSVLVIEIATGACKWLQGGTLRAGRLLNACVNVPPVLFALAAALTLWLFARRENDSRSVVAVAALWLNPALILTSPILGYQDPIFAFFGLLALICFYQRKPALSMLFLALSCLIKPQGVFIIPVLAAAFWAEGGWRMLWRSSMQFLLSLIVLASPYLVSGRLLAPLAAILHNSTCSALSAQDASGWWIAGPVAQAIAGRTLDPLFGKIEMVPPGEFQAAIGIHPLWLAMPALILFTAINIYWMVRHLRKGHRHAIFWAAALEVYGYTMFALYVHENHLYAFFVYSAPLLAIARAPIRRIYWALSVVFGLNLFMFEGLGQGFIYPGWLRTFQGVDLTILLAMANITIFVLIVRSRNWWFDCAQENLPKDLPGAA